MHFGFTFEETRKTQASSATRPLTLVSQVRAFEFNRQISDYGLKTKHVPIIGVLIIVH